MNKLNSSFVKFISDLIPKSDAIILAYGSNIYDEVISDLDICIIVDDVDYSELFASKIIERTITFHNINHLPLDEEISFRNKTVFTKSEIKKLCMENPFILNDGTFYICPVIKAKWFLESDHMRERLLINILTAEHLLLSGKPETLLEYENIAWNVILKAVFRANNINKYDSSKAIELLYFDSKTNSTGELYLGYDPTDSRKDAYLKKKLSSISFLDI